MYIPFIYKERYRETGLGLALERNCPTCRKPTWWALSRVRKLMIILIYIPITAWKRHVVKCQVCTTAVRIGDDLVPVALQTVELSTAFIAQQLSREDYVARVSEPAHRINAALDVAQGVAPAPAPAAAAPSEAPAPPPDPADAVPAPAPAPGTPTPF